MSIDEHARHLLYLRLEEHLGSEAASTLMEHLPPTGWSEVATKRDLDQLRAVTKADLDHLQVVTRADLDHFQAVNRADHDALEARLEKSIERMRGDLLKTMSTHTIAIVFTMMATMLAGLFAVAQMR